ncbi:MAG: AAA family ATPase [Nitrososphaerales archaeon]
MHRLRNINPLVLWLTPLAIVFSVVATAYLVVIADQSLILALSVAAAYAVLLSIGTWLLDKLLRRRFAAKSSLDVETNNIQPSDNEELRRQKRIMAVRREAQKMHDRVIKMMAIIGLIFFLYWLYMYIVKGYVPKEVFLIPLPLLVLAWFLIIVLFPVWLTYSTVFGAIMLHAAFELWGAQILILLPNFLMLPFFYFFMMIFMFGSIMIPNLMQLKFYKPGDATWEVPKGTMRGQPEARAIVEMEMEKFENYALGKTDRPATRGMIFEGPPGTGKTLLAKELGTEYDLPFAFTDAQAFNAPFFGFGPLIVYYFKWRTEQLAKEYGGAIVFIDEAETLLQQRAGMGIPGSKDSVWDLFPKDNNGRVIFGNFLVDDPATKARHLAEVSKPIKHPIFFGGGGFAGGANAAIFPFLTWLNGADSPPFFKKLVRRKINDLLHALYIPPVIKGRIFRLPPGKPVRTNLMFIAATNRAWMLDDAIRRPGRFGVTVRFKTPDFQSRVEVAELYFTESVNKNWMRPELNTPEKHEELARSTQGMTPAEIEAVIKQAPDVRMHLVHNMRRIGRMLDSGKTLEDLSEDDQKFWKRHGSEYGKEGWDDTRADWWSLMEARSQVLWGRATPGITSEAHKEVTAVHEFMGHFLPLKAFMGDAMRPQVLTVMPRGSALGMVAYVPIEERDPMPQSFYEAMLRVSIGSVMAERFYYGENQPGVVADLENATNIAAFMVSKCAMVPYDWLSMNDDEKDYYKKIGETFIATPINYGQVKTVTELALQDDAKLEKIKVFLGKAAVDVYRLIQANAHLAKPVVDELLELDEFSGAKLEELWNWLDDNLNKFDNKYINYNQPLPDRHFSIKNPFYEDTDTEGILNEDK